MKTILIILVAVFTAAAQYPDTILESIAVGQNPTDICISPDGNTAYVAVGFGFTTVVDITEYADYSINALVSIEGVPAAIECDSSGEFVYVADSENNFLHIIETSDFTVTNTLEILPDPTDMIRYSSGNKIYLSHGNGMISVINTQTQLIDECYWAGNDINSLCINNSENLIVAADNQSPNEVLIDPASGLVSTFSSDSDNFGCSFSGNGEFLFLSNPGWNTISVVNSTSLNIEATITCPDITPERMAPLPSLSYLYGTCSDDNKLKAVGFDPSGIYLNSPNFSAEIVNSPAQSPSISISAELSGTLFLRVFDLSGRLVQANEVSIGQNETLLYNVESD